MILHTILYIDPGSGSLLFQLLIAGLAGFVAFVKIYWNKIKEFLGPKKRDESK